jgi:hypothetical protein
MTTGGIFVRRTAVVGVASCLVAIALCGCTTAAAEKPKAQRDRLGRLPVETVRSDAFAILKAGGASWIDSDDRATIDASAAIAAAAIEREGPVTVVSATKVRLSDQTVRGRLVWVVGAEPAMLRDSGRPGGAQRLRTGREVIVIDANSGQQLERAGRPGWGPSEQVVGPMN